MPQHHLIVSNPPQPSGNLSDAAALFGLEPFEVRQKANYSVPEIWFADEDEARVAETANSLATEGLRVARISGGDFAAVGPQRHVTSVEFQEAAMVLATDGEEVVVPYDAAPVGVFCEPRALSPDGPRTSGSALGSRLSHTSEMLGGQRQSSVARAVETGEGSAGQKAFLDLYLQGNGGARRFSIDRASLDSERGSQRSSGGHQNLSAFVAQCADRLPAAVIDRRLVGMILRKPLAVGEAPHSRRKGFSFATQALAQLLSQISPGLESVAQTDLSSRLAYLTLKA